MTVRLEERRLDRIFSEVKTKVPLGDIELLTPSIVLGVVPQSSLPHRPHQVTRDEFVVHPTKPGDFVISMSSFQHGFEYCGIHGGISSDYTLLRPKFHPDIGRFLKHSLKSNLLIQKLTVFRSGIRQGQRLQWNRVRYVKIPVPDTEGARRVADFLDRETARIDRLIEKKQRLVELIEERRSAMITSAVTSGSCRCRRRQQGISHDDTPESWDRQKIKYHLSAFFGGGTPSKENPDYWTDGIIPWVTPKDMKRRLIDSAEDLITNEAVRNSATNLVPPCSVLMVVRSGILKRALPVALNTVPVALNQDMKAFRFRSTLIPEFFALWVEGQQKQKLLEWRQTGATVDNIDIDAMLNGEITVPDVAAQRKIAELTGLQTAKMDVLKAKTVTSIDRLKELRGALVTAAVTGQIDVTT